MSSTSNVNVSFQNAALAHVQSILSIVKDILHDKGDRSVARRAALNAFAIRVGSAGIAYISQVLLARWLGSFEFGVFVFVWVLVIMIGGLATIGLNTSVMRFIPEYAEKGQTALLRGLLLSSRIVAVSISVTIGVLGLSGLYFFGDYLSHYYILPAYLVLICLPLYTLADIQDGIARSYSWVNLALVPIYILRPVLIFAFMVAAYMLDFPMTAVTAAVCAIIASLISAVTQLLMLERKLDRQVAKGHRDYNIGLWIRTSFPMFLIEGFDMILTHTDILVLTRFSSPTDVAIYFAAVKTMALVAFIRFAVSAAVANKFSAYNARGDKQVLAAFVSDAVHWTFWPSLAGSGLIILLGWPLLSMFGPEFVSGYPVLFILALGFLSRAATGPAEYVLNMLGEQKACATVLSLAALLNLVLNVTLIPSFGLIGAAIATSVSLATASTLFFLVAKHKLDLNISIRRRSPLQQKIAEEAGE